MRYLRSYIRLIILFTPSSINQIHTSESYIYTIINQSMKIFAFIHLKVISIPSTINQWINESTNLHSYVWKLNLYHHQSILHSINQCNQSINEHICVHMSKCYIFTIINQSNSYVWKLYLYHNQSIIQSINENIRVHTSESYIYTVINQSDSYVWK